jgi:integrase
VAAVQPGRHGEAPGQTEAATASAGARDAARIIEAARLPARLKPQPHPPGARDAARIIEATWQRDDEWGLYIWLAMVTGARRGELLALRWHHIDLDTAILTVRRHYVRANGEGYDKDTKSHQMRRLPIDEATVGLHGSPGQSSLRCGWRLPGG